MKPTKIVSLGICFLFLLDLAQSLYFFVVYAEAWFWKKLVAGVLIETGYIMVYAERDISVLTIAIIVSVFLLANSIRIVSFVSLALASFIVHYLIETLVDSKYRLFALVTFIPTVLMSYSTHLKMDTIHSSDFVPLSCLFALFATQALLKTCFRTVI